jgi:CheY-like chemotaxis protein
VGGTLREFQSEGVAAAKAAHALAIPEARQRLLPILAAMPGASYLPELVSGIYDAQLDPPTRSYLASVMESRLGHLPGQTETLNWLGQQLKDQFHTWKIASQTDVPADRTVWRIDGGKLQDVVGDERQLAAGQTLQTALMMLRSADLPEDIAALPMALALEALAQFPPASQSDPIVALKSLVPHDRWNSVTLWPQVYQAAGDSVLPRAAYQALRQMESLQSNDQVPSDAIAGSLVDAARHGAMALRYAATSQLAPRWLAGAGTVAGASQSIADNLQEMSRLEGAPLVLIAGRDASLRSIATRALKPLGIRTAEVNDARELLRWVEQPNPVEAILAVDRIGIGDLSEAQWVQKLRAHRRTRDIPIGLLSNDIPEAQDWVLAETPRLFRAPMPGSIEAMDQIWQQCQRLAGGAPVDAAQRWQWKSVADRILAEVARKPPNQRPAGTDRWPLEPWDGRVEWEPNQLDHDKKILPVSQTSKNTSN